jgi:hypothetical protein
VEVEEVVLEVRQEAEVPEVIEFLMLLKYPVALEERMK